MPSTSGKYQSAKKNKTRMFFSTLLFILLVTISNAVSFRANRITMHFEEAIVGNTKLTTNSLKSERYIATNRFNVRKNAGPKFEKRWAERKSRLAQLEGFRFFTLLKRVTLPGDNDNMYNDEGDMGNYISFTIWENKDNFNEWRTGEAFKEAHGGGGITDFMQLLSTALFILKGAPKPAFYDGLIPVAGEKLNFEQEGGWRTIVADGINYLEPEIFVTQNRFKVKAEMETAFEKRWAERESRLKEVDGFVGFFMLRRDATKADDGYNYIATTIWKNKTDFENWKNSSQFSAAHRKDSTTAPPSTTSPDSMFLDKPKMAFYEGKLALSSPVGI